MANSSIWLYTGKLVDVLNIEATSFDIYDFSHALAQINRYTGNTLFPYSVSEHSTKLSLVTEVQKLGLARAALLHDCSEVIVNDLPSPVKAQLPDYEELEVIVQKWIFECFKEPWQNMVDLTIFDKRMCRAEMEQVFPEPKYIDRETLGNRVDFWSPPVAEHFFLKRAVELNLV